MGESEEFETLGFGKLETDTLNAIKQTYFTGDFDKTQGRLAYGADLGIVSVEECARYYDELGHFDTGIFGTDILCELLFENGYADVFGKLMENDKVGSYLYMKRNNATTIWESWNVWASHCHPMFGGPARQLFTGILGIKATSPNFETYEIKPNLPKNMNYAKGFITTSKGKISVEVRRNGENVEVKTEVI